MRGFPLFSDQSPFDVRFDWGERGLETIGQGCSVVVVVDVFSFCTSVEIATARGASILPWRWRDETAARFAESHDALLAGDMRSLDRYSLSPSSLVEITPGTRLVLPSRNGAVLTLQTSRSAVTVAACLRNASAVSRFVQKQGGPVAIIGGGERWPDDSLRPAWEDLVGAGAVIAGLGGACSPEAQAACAAWLDAREDLADRLKTCSSARELRERGFAGDIDLAAAFDAGDTVPVLRGEAYVATSPN